MKKYLSVGLGVFVLGLMFAGTALAKVTVPKTLNSVSLDGATSVSVSSGQTISISVVATSNDEKWEATQYTIEGSSAVCIDTPNHNNQNTASTETFNITAPGVAGIYDFTVTIYEKNDCKDKPVTLTLSDAITVSAPPVDTDADTIPDSSDNCPSVANPLQADADNDGVGDDCDSTPNGDTDGDGIDQNADNCPSVSNTDQKDTDGDGSGDECDQTPNGDDDGDGIDNLSDNCSAIGNSGQEDADGDGIGDACDTTPTGDDDEDGVDNATDNCPVDVNTDQLDTDGDGTGDICDETPNGDENSGGEDETTTYTITVSAGANGSITPAGDEGSVSVEEGDSQEFTITADPGYHIVDVLVDEESQGAIATYTFSEVGDDHTISATFEADQEEQPTEEEPRITTGSVARTTSGQVLGAEKFVFTQYMAMGSTGNEVMELQKYLQSLGLYWGKIDGIFGVLTEAAVKAFQMANPPLKVDGIVGPLTRAVLNK